MKAAIEHTKIFCDFGIIFEQFGKNCLSIDATPIYLKNLSIEDIIKQAVHYMDELRESDRAQFQADLQKKVYAAVACKAAVKAGDVLTQEQMQQLLSDLETVNNRFLCPHGRPTGRLLHDEEIKKMFKRDYRS